MADLSITVANVVPGANAQKATGIAGVTITAFQPLYKDTTDLDAENRGKLKLADADSSALTAQVEGLSLHGALAGQPVTYVYGGLVTLNAVLTQGKAYVASANAGMVAPIADMTTNWRTSLLGFAVSTTVFDVRIINTGITN